MQGSNSERVLSSDPAVLRVVEAYQAGCGHGFPDLRGFAARAARAYRPVALAELVKIELQRRWRAGQPKWVEDYLAEYSELRDASVSREELIRYECIARSRHADRPSLEELTSRFPELAADRLRQIWRSATTEVLEGHAGETAEPERPHDEPDRTDSKRSKTVSSPGVRDIRTADYSTRRRGRSVTHPTHAAVTRSEHGDALDVLRDRIGRYRVVDLLGSGGFGVVYRCYDDNLKQYVAVKMARPEACTGYRREGALHEAQSAARLRHPGIVQVLNADISQDGQMFVVYEFIEGRTLAERVKQGDIECERAALWVADIADALHYAHSKGVVHRDIKPANILLDDEERPHVADFGLARVDDHYFIDDRGKVTGTPAYMSPEQASGHSHWASPQSDIYSLGVVLYELLCFQLPFRASEMRDLVDEISSRAPVPPRCLDDTVPKAFEDVCLRAMRKDPADRYTTAADMSAALRRALEDRARHPGDRHSPPVDVSAQLAQPEMGEGTRRRVLAYVAIGAVLAAACLGVFYWKLSSAPTPSAEEMLDAWHESEGIGALEPEMPLLEVHMQKAQESERYHKLKEIRSSDVDWIASGDRVQLLVDLGEARRYVYLWWYGTSGQPRRFWPPTDCDLEAQVMCSRVVSPDMSNQDKWWPVTGEPGTEMALVAVTEEPLTTTELNRYEQLYPYAERPAATLDAPREIRPSDERPTERNLGPDPEISAKYPMSATLHRALNSRFETFHAIVIPHR
jgi:predicted Ser/Thr protein kinase